MIEDDVSVEIYASSIEHVERGDGVTSADCYCAFWVALDHSFGAVCLCHM